MLHGSKGRQNQAPRFLIMNANVPTIIERAAAEIVDRYGPDAVPILRECAERAVELGDEMAAEEWRDLPTPPSAWRREGRE
jgi:hypothetical protein